MIKPDTKHPRAKFGTQLGVALGDVPVYSSDYDSADENELPNRHAFRSYIGEVFMGYKWQCVELARRWLYVNKGHIFDDVAMAYDIFQLRFMRRVTDDAQLPVRSFRNGSPRRPEPGCLMIWSEGGEFKVTGHVAVVTEVFDDRVRVVEQNVHDSVWPQGQTFSRELRSQIADDGGYWVECDLHGSSILGWVIQTDDNTHAEDHAAIDKRLFGLKLRAMENHGQADHSWLNIANATERNYVAMMGGHKLASDDADQYHYMVVSSTAQKELKRATNELHALFMHATDYVLQNDELLGKFNLPRALWPKIRQSWDNRRNQMITGRFDFALTEDGLKLYEYNADSASCYMECGFVQGRWAEHFGCREGWNPGRHLFDDLVEAWQDSEAEGVLHILQDNDLEETYHALYMQSAIEAAGITCKVITGVKDLAWDTDGDVVDKEGMKIKWVWKTWAWETALDQIRAECEHDADKLHNYQFDKKRSAPPRLVDVLLRENVMVFEPLWTLIASNKAILPILWEIMPDYPYLLNSQFELTPELRTQGYVTKPIAGRCGLNITMVDHDSALVGETRGRFARQDQIYQALFKLPRIGKYNTQVCTFSVAGTYAGICVRTDPTLVITKDSDVMPLRVVSDGEFLRAED